MRVWDRKRKPKHWTKPKWKTRALKTSTIINYCLVTRGIKDKYANGESFFEKLKKINNKPMYKFLASSKKLNNKRSGNI